MNEFRLNFINQIDSNEWLWCVEFRQISPRQTGVIAVVKWLLTAPDVNQVVFSGRFALCGSRSKVVAVFNIFVFRLFIFLQGCKRRWTTVSRLFCRVARPLTALQRPRIVARICGRILCWLRPLRWARRNLKKIKKIKEKGAWPATIGRPYFYFFWRYYRYLW